MSSTLYIFLQQQSKTWRAAAWQATNACSKAVLRVLGGSRRQLRMAQASEFAAIGLLSGLVAAIAASILSGLIATRVFDLPWQPNWSLAIAGGALGMFAALIAGLFATRRVLDAPPSVTLREL